MDLGQVFTSQAVASYMASLLHIPSNASVLDPCFGNGAFIRACLELGFANIEGFEIDRELFEAVKGRYPGLTLYHGDFLKADETRRYDAVIMNPPYIRQEKIDELKPLGITKKRIRKNPIYAGLPTTANMYMYFIVKALKLLENNGEMAVIFPGSWLKAKSGRDFETLLKSLASVERQIHISGTIFEKEALVEVIILKLKKGPAPSAGLVEYIELKNGKLQKADLHEAERETISLPVRFSEYAFVRRGLTTGCNGLYINPPIEEEDARQCLIPILSSPKDICGYTTRAASADRLLCPGGEDMPDSVARYLKAWEKKIRKERSPKTLYERIRDHKPWFPITPVDSRGILFSYFVRNDMKFVLNDGEVLARDNFYVITPQIPVYLLFALLNNLYTYYQLESSGKKYGAGLLKLQRYDIENLTFPDINHMEEKDKETLVSLAMTMTAENRTQVRGMTEVLAAYMPWGFDRITREYEALKKNRLEGR